MPLSASWNERKSWMASSSASRPGSEASRYALTLCKPAGGNCGAGVPGDRRRDRERSRCGCRRRLSISRAASCSSASSPSSSCSSDFALTPAPARVTTQRVFGPHRTGCGERRYLQHEQFRLQRLSARLLRLARGGVHLVDRMQHAFAPLEAHEPEVAAEQDLPRVLQTSPANTAVASPTAWIAFDRARPVRLQSTMLRRPADR